MTDYFCKDEYDGPAYDLNPWGVNDEEFGQFIIKTIDAIKKPFFATWFTLSSHHPFVVPERYIGKFPKSEHPIGELIAYTDHALKIFFDEVKTKDWYEDTLFVFVADHTNGATQNFYKNSIGRYSIPIMFFDPSGDLKFDNSQETLIQHIDLMPTLMDLHGLDDEIFMFGSSVFDENAPRFAITFGDNIYQLIKDDYVLHFDGEKTVGFYQKSDYLLKSSLLLDEQYASKIEELEIFIKAFLQQFEISIIENKMTAKARLR